MLAMKRLKVGVKNLVKAMVIKSERTEVNEVVFGVWDFEEVFIKINGVLHYPGRAVCAIRSA